VEPLHENGITQRYRKLTFTLAPEDYGRLIAESARRRIAGDSNRVLSALLREAVSDYLERLQQKSQPAGTHS
jgi:hypothetical protein